MGILRSASVRLEKLDESVEAARESFTSQTALNIALSAGVCVAILVALVALVRSSE